MSATTSAATGRCFGIQRVCQVWERSRSALYARRARAHHHRLGAGPARRGAPPRQSDAQLLAAIRTDLARSPFHGEGHRKVHGFGSWTGSESHAGAARHAGARTAHRGRQGAAKTHDGRVITQAPNVMWGTDGVRVSRSTTGGAGSSQQSNTGTRSAWGGTSAKSGAASRHSIRLRKGSNVAMARWTPTARGRRFGHVVSVRFPKQIRSTPASALSRNRKRTGWRSGNRTLKEQAIHGRIFQNLAAVRAAVADFVERYNQTWRLEKLGYHTPIEAREV